MSAEVRENPLRFERNPLNAERVHPEQHLGLAQHVLRRVHHRFDDDDLSAAVVVLVEAARDWNSDRRPDGVSWTTFAANQIRSSRLNTWRTGAEKARRLEVDLYLRTGDGDEAREIERPEMAREDVALRQSAARRDVRELLAGLEDREAFVLWRRFGLGQAEPSTLDEIGKELDVTRERVRQIEQKALRALRRRANRRRIGP